MEDGMSDEIAHAKNGPQHNRGPKDKTQEGPSKLLLIVPRAPLVRQYTGI